jgi:citrate lyase subunit beta/citryl-CoA lyase
MVAKLPSLAADAVLLDLEDGVAPVEKEAARRNLDDARRNGLLDGPKPRCLRVNPPDSPWHDADLALASRLRPSVVVLPKAEEPERVRRLAGRCEAWGGRVGLMIETARGVAGVEALSRCHPAVELLIYGSADYRRSIGARPGGGRDWESLAMQRILLAARIGGCQAIDGVYFRYRDQEGLRAEARIARQLGFDGKSCIHPAQVPPIHEVFSSTDGEIAWARAVGRAWAEQRGESSGVVVLDGEMIERLHLDIAHRILERAGDAATEDAS